VTSSKVRAIATIALFMVSAVGTDAQTNPAPTPPVASAPTKDVATLLFGEPQWSKAPAGSTITYSYSKKATEPAFGASFDDHITMKLDAGADPTRRTVEVKMFSGANAKPAGPFDSVEQNPVLLLVLEENVQEFSKLFKANPRYLKNAIRKAWRDDAKVVATDVMVDGKPVPGTRITVTPFVNDPETDKMMGLDGIAYVVELADSIPGVITMMDIRAPVTGAATFSETLHYQTETH
jgi:hypothetical protein